jgi:DNA polymerase elongation subunit (family B)
MERTILGHLLYLDIETNSKEDRSIHDAKVISIQFRDGNGNTTVLKEWLSSEKTILKEFHGHLLKLRETGSITIVGHNMLRFDIPMLIHRMVLRKIDTHQKLLDLFHDDVYGYDTLQCLTPFNNFRFKGLNAQDLSNRLSIRPPKHDAREIPEFYNKKQYKKIEEHVLADLDFTEDLWKKLKENTHELGSLLSEGP